MLMIMLKRQLILIVLFAILICNVSCRPFLSGIFQFGPTTPESHISDYHNQPKTKMTENLEIVSDRSDTNNAKNAAEIIGNIFNSVRTVRERVTNVLGNLLQPGTTNSNGEEQQQQKQMEQSNKKVSTLNVMDVKMNYEHQNKLNLDTKKNSTEVKNLVEQIKDGDADKPISHNEVEMNNKMLHKNEIIKSEKLMENVEMKLNNDTSEIIDAFFDLDNDDIFYGIERNSTNQIVQRPRLFPLIFSSLVKYRNQSDKGLLQNSTIRERNRIRALYMLRPIIGVLRRKEENTKVREQLKAMEAIMVEMIKRNLSESQLQQIDSYEMHKLARKRAKMAFSTAFDRQFESKTLLTANTKQENNKIVDANSTTLSSTSNQVNEIGHENDVEHSAASADDEDNYNDDENNSDDDEVEEGKSTFAIGETFGILMLELIGTVAGLTWGAISQLTHYIQGMGN